MRWLAVLLLFLPQDPGRCSAVPLLGLSSNACYAAVREAAAAEFKAAATWRVDGTAVRLEVHGPAPHPYRLSTLDRALTAAEKKLKETLRMVVDYRADEEAFRLEGTLRIWGTGTIDAEALGRLLGGLPGAALKEAAPLDGAWAAVLEWTAPAKLSSVRQAVEAGGLKLTDSEFPGFRPPTSEWACPRGCARSTGEGHCPECGQALVRRPPPPEGG